MPAKNSVVDEDDFDDEELESSNEVEDEDDGPDEDDESSEESSDESSDETADETSEESSDETSAESDEKDSTDEEREAIRERRRQERKLRKQRAHEREERFRKELATRDAAISELQQQLGVINKKNFSSELVQLDSAIGQAANAYEHFKAQLADGAKAGDGQVVADATEKMFQARQAAEHYSNIKKAILTAQNRPPAVDPRITNKAKSWCDQNKWYDPSGRNLDSRVTMAIDDALVQEGYDPASDDYWSELSNRVKKYLPHRANVVYNKNTGTTRDTRVDSRNSGEPVVKKPKSVVTGSDRESHVGKGEYQLSSERKRALQEAGLWDDPKARNAAIKRYKEFDRINGKA